MEKREGQEGLGNAASEKPLFAGREGVLNRHVLFIAALLTPNDPSAVNYYRREGRDEVRMPSNALNESYMTGETWVAKLPNRLLRQLNGSSRYLVAVLAINRLSLLTGLIGAFLGALKK